jgi:hypothetical protein
MHCTLASVGGASLSFVDTFLLAQYLAFDSHCCFFYRLSLAATVMMAGIHKNSIPDSQLGTPVVEESQAN